MAISYYNHIYHISKKVGFWNYVRIMLEINVMETNLDRIGILKVLSMLNLICFLVIIAATEGICQDLE